MQKYIKVCFPFSRSRCKHIIMTDVIEHRFLQSVKIGLNKNTRKTKHILTISHRLR